MKKLFFCLTVAVLLMPAFIFATQASAQGEIDADYLWGGDATDRDTIQGEIGLGDKDPREIAAAVIRVIMGFLGIVAVVIILIGGFKWMTAGGNEEKVGEARKLIISGIIGLVIILAAFGIATFVINSLINATGTGA